jgi:type IV secretory pathway TrbD component
VYQSLQRPKLLLGGEWEAALINMYATLIFMVLALFSLNWRMALLSLFCGTCLQWGLRVFAQKDPDYFKRLLEAIRHPHIREPNYSNFTG